MKWISWIFTVTNCNCKVVVNWENESGSLGLLKRAMAKVSKSMNRRSWTKSLSSVTQLFIRGLGHTILGNFSIDQVVIEFFAQHTYAFWRLILLWLFPSKVRWAGAGVKGLRRISLTTNSSCWTEIALSLSFFDGFVLPPEVAEVFLAFLRFGTPGWFCITKGKISFGPSFFWFSTDSLRVNLLCDRSVSIRRSG